MTWQKKVSEGIVLYLNMAPSQKQYLVIDLKRFLRIRLNVLSEALIP